MQYYDYYKILEKQGIIGLEDQRKNRAKKKITPKIIEFITAVVKKEPNISARELKKKIQKEFKIYVSKTSLNKFRKVRGIKKIERPKVKVIQVHETSGGEILTALAEFSGIIDLWTKTIMDRIDEIRNSTQFYKNNLKQKDHPGYRAKGKFTKRYNQLKSVRKSRFKSIDEKIPGKNYSSMDIFKKSAENISRYNLALLCLPLVTNNGKSSRINRVKGNDLEFLCGYNYKDASVDKYLRELKYLKVSENLISETAKFWMKFWQEKGDEKTIFVCYYIDGNTKALWSSERCYKGKVTMLGRVMNCLENVFIHDGKGHPLYFQTFQGHADLGKHALGMINRLTSHFGDLSSQISIKRILVLDGAGNSVKTMRAFTERPDNENDKEANEHFITILDKNQTKERRFKNLGKKHRYKYGKATLVDCQIELPDSSDSKYIFESRSVIVQWDNGRESVLVTDISRELLDASEITKKYFDRWPMQEKQFRDMKGPLNIHRIVGYGKKSEQYDKMIEKMKKLKNTIQKLKRKLRKPLIEINKVEKKLSSLYITERKLKEKSKIEDGKRILNEVDSEALKQCTHKINKYLRNQNEIKKNYKEDFIKLKINEKELKRIQFKDKVYRIDTELDQIMTCFKLSFANLCSFFLSECLKNKKYELLTLFESIFELKGEVEITKSERIIKLKRNFKEHKLMQQLAIAIKRLNSLRIRDTKNRITRIALSG